MSVISHGIDVTEIAEIQKQIESETKNWLEGVYSSKERRAAPDGPESIRYFAGRFAAKEAIAKALGTGFSGAVTWDVIEVLRADSGKPIVHLTGAALECSQALGISNWSLSISYTSQLAFASVIASGEG